jgi:archaellum component FlaC
MEEGSYLMEKKIEYLIDMKIGKFKNELVEAQNQMRAMLQEMDVLKNKVQRLNTLISAIFTANDCNAIAKT